MPAIYTKVKVIKITQTQHDTLVKLRSRKVNVAQFIRKAIQEKIQRDHKELTTLPKKISCPF